MNEKWKWVKAKDFIEFNPKERLSKGKEYKKISMDDLKPFTKSIPNFTIEEYKGGSKFRNGDTLMARITPSLENGKTSQVDLLDDMKWDLDLLNLLS